MMPAGESSTSFEKAIRPSLRVSTGRMPLVESLPSHIPDLRQTLGRARKLKRGPRLRRQPLIPRLAVGVIIFSSAPSSILNVGTSSTGVLVAAEARPQTDLTSNCFNFPERNFDRDNSIKAVNEGHTPFLPMEAGDYAIDFTLHDTSGQPWNLRDTLEATGKPVVMIWGMFTCPAFQGYGTEPPWDMASYWEEYHLVETYKDRVSFVHLYGPEPHPSYPGTNFDVGKAWQSYWSTVGQHRIYDDRVGMAKRISDVIHPDQVILPDYLPGNPYSDLVQPVWCSYAMAARAVTIVSPNGKLLFQRGWFHAGHVSRAIDEYWCNELDGQYQAPQQESVRDKKITTIVTRGVTAAAGTWCKVWDDDIGYDDDGGQWPDSPPLA